MKVAIIGAGNVGAMVASRVVDANLADVTLVDVAPGIAKGKALDISDARPVFNSTSNITGTENFADIQDSDIIVITAGLARKPGMSREDLIKKNTDIIKEVAMQIKKYCPSPIVIVVTNPLDEMSYLVMKTTGFSPRKVIGMAGVLDTARFINALWEKNQGVEQDKVMMMGSHGDTMVSINRSENISPEMFFETSKLARNRGAEIVKHLGTGSAYFAPSASVFFMLKAIIKNENKTLCASAYLNGQYGEKDIYIGVPVILNSSGIKEVIEIPLTSEEKSQFQKSAHQIRENITKILQ
ncbi:MAG: malate dehydrogenase [Candidatus Omnitrophica bacterium]|nr:malate dehydrogenase [Candidatus Omnitrophota bacterium]